MAMYRKRKYRRKQKIFKFFTKANILKLKSPFLWRGIFCFIILGLLVYAGKVIYYSNIFMIKNIDSNVEISPSVRRPIIGESLFTLDMKKVLSQIKSKYPRAKDVNIVKKFPDVLKVEVSLRQAFAQIKQDKFYPIDREGVIVEYGSSLEFDGLIPIEIVDENISLAKSGRLDDERLKCAFDLIDVLQRSDFMGKFDVKIISITSAEAMYFIVEEKKSSLSSVPATVKIIIGDGDFSHKLYLFENVLEQKLKGDLSLLEYVDLRYKKVYLGFKR